MAQEHITEAGEDSRAKRAAALSAAKAWLHSQNRWQFVPRENSEPCCTFVVDAFVAAGIIPAESGGEYSTQFAALLRAHTTQVEGPEAAEAGDVIVLCDGSSPDEPRHVGFIENVVRPLAAGYRSAFKVLHADAQGVREGMLNDRRKIHSIWRVKA